MEPGILVSEEFIETVKYVSTILMHRVPATEVEGTDPKMTTYTLGLILGGAVSLEPGS